MSTRTKKLLQYTEIVFFVLLLFYEDTYIAFLWNNKYSCSCVDSIRIAQKTLPDTKVFGVTVLTSLDKDKCGEIFSCSPEDGVLRFAKMANCASLHGLILSPEEVIVVKVDSELKNLELITHGIRPEWSFVEGDDQSGVMTPAQAIKNGADRIVIGRNITRT